MDFCGSQILFTAPVDLRRMNRIFLYEYCMYFSHAFKFLPNLTYKNLLPFPSSILKSISRYFLDVELFQSNCMKNQHEKTGFSSRFKGQTEVNKFCICLTAFDCNGPF